MFEFWLDEFSRYGTHRIWGRLKKQQTVSIDEVDEFIRMEGAQFLSFILLTVGNVGEDADTQKKFLTFFLAYKGCSATGRDTLARAGFGAKKSSYRKWRAKKVQEANAKARYD